LNGAHPNELTKVLHAAYANGSRPEDAILPLVYGEMRRIAAGKLAKEHHAQSLQPTALVNEAYLRLVAGAPIRWDSRGHFFAAAAEAMRRILIDNARQKASVRHGGGLRRRILNENESALPSDDEDLLALDEALGRLAETDREAADLVKLRFFAGLSVEQAAALLGMSPRSGYYAWNYARAWLRRAIRGD
jgi:RNA polymerase sigma factor (TIGR02999 family)